MQFVALNIALDQINAFPGFEIIVQRHHFNLESATCVSLGWVSPMINIQLIGKYRACSCHCVLQPLHWQTCTFGSLRVAEHSRMTFFGEGSKLWTTPLEP